MQENKNTSKTVFILTTTTIAWDAAKTVTRQTKLNASESTKAHQNVDYFHNISNHNKRGGSHQAAATITIITMYSKKQQMTTTAAIREKKEEEEVRWPSWLAADSQLQHRLHQPQCTSLCTYTAVNNQAITTTTITTWQTRVSNNSMNSKKVDTGKRQSELAQHTGWRRQRRRL